MTINPPSTIGQTWGYKLSNAPTAADSDYVLNTLAYTADGTLYMIIDNTPAAAVWIKQPSQPI